MRAEALEDGSLGLPADADTVVIKGLPGKCDRHSNSWSHGNAATNVQRLVTTCDRLHICTVARGVAAYLQREAALLC